MRARLRIADSRRKRVNNIVVALMALIGGGQPLMKDEYISETRAAGSPATFADSLAAEASLLLSSPRTITNGVCDRVSHFVENPGELLVLAASSAALGAGLSYLARRPGLGSTITSIVPYTMGLAVATDIGLKIGGPMRDAWNSPFDRETHQTQLGKNVGGLLVDYTALGLSGYAGAKAICKLPGGAMSENALGADLDGLVRAVRNGFEPPKQLASDSRFYRWSKGCDQRLADYKAGKYTEKPFDTYGAELDASTNKLGEALNEHLARHGMPATKFEWDGLSRAHGQMLEGQGTVEYGARSLARSARREIADLTVHELTHVDQDQITIRRLADKLGIAEQATPDQIGVLKERYHAITQQSLTDEYAARVLEFRNGKHLDAKQAARADLLIEDAVSSVANANRRVALDKQYDDIGLAIKDVSRGSGLSVASDILRSPERARYFLGDEPITPELQKALVALSEQSPYARQIKYDPERVLLRDALRKQIDFVYKQLGQCQTTYFQSMSEREAFTMGARAGWQYLLNGRISGPLVAISIPATINDVRTGYEWIRGTDKQ